MRAKRFRPQFDRLCARITPSDPGVTMVPATPISTVDPLDPPIPVSYADSGSSGSWDTILDPPIPVNYAH